MMILFGAIIAMCWVGEGNKSGKIGSGVGVEKAWVGGLLARTHACSVRIEYVRLDN
jgi:hypothetical protein